MKIEFSPNFVWKISAFERNNIHSYERIQIEESKTEISKILQISINSINHEFIQQKEEINKIEEAIFENTNYQYVNINPIREIINNIHFSINLNFQDFQKNFESFNPNFNQQCLILKRKLLIELVKTHAKLSALNSIIRKLFSNLNLKYERVCSLDNSMHFNPEEDVKKESSIKVFY